MPASRNPLTLAVLVSLWLASVGNWPLWRALTEPSDLSSMRGTLFIASLGVVFVCICLALSAWLAAQAGSPEPKLRHVTDHAESLGRKCMFLHGLPYPVAPREQTHVPMPTWLPPQTEAAVDVTRACLQERCGQPPSHDHFSHAVLGLMGVGSGGLKPALDSSSECRSV